MPNPQARLRSVVRDMAIAGTLSALPLPPVSSTRILPGGDGPSGYAVVSSPGIAGAGKKLWKDGVCPTVGLGILRDWATSTSTFMRPRTTMGPASSPPDVGVRLAEPRGRSPMELPSTATRSAPAFYTRDEEARYMPGAPGPSEATLLKSSGTMAIPFRS